MYHSELKPPKTFYNFGFSRDEFNRKFIRFLPDYVISRMPMYDFHIDQLANYLDWDIMSTMELADWIIVKYRDKINWPVYLTNGKAKDIDVLVLLKQKILDHSYVFSSERMRALYYTDAFVLSFPEIINWDWYSRKVKIPDYIILKFWNKFTSANISKYQSITTDIIKKYKYHINWYQASMNELTEDAIYSVIELINWKLISKYQKLSIEFIRKNIHYLDAYSISRYQKLTEEFISEFNTRLDMSAISRYQKLSVSFIVANIEILIPSSLILNKFYTRSSGVQIIFYNSNYYIVEIPLLNNENNILYCNASIII